MKKKIAIVFPWLNLYGGGEIFLEYCSNLLSKHYYVDLFIYDNKKKKHDNINFKDTINIIKIKSNNFIVDFFCQRFMIFAQAYIIYYFGLIKKNSYFFVFSASGEFFSKFKTFQYIHMCIFSKNFLEYQNFGLNNFFKKLLRFFAVIITRFILNIDKNKFLNVVTLTNSKWSLRQLNKTYTIKSKRVVYPTFAIPKLKKTTYKQFCNRLDNFIILGRVSNDKNIIEGIKFFLKLNEIIPKVKLHIVGPIDKDYYNSIPSKYLNNNNVVFHGLLSKKNRNKLLSKSKYGLNFFHSEHFGRGVLEMQKMGMIVFAKNKGGVREILFNSYQKYNNYYDLMSKIKQVIYSSKLQKKILLKNQKYLINNFSDKNFRNNFIPIFNKTK
jgi:glycosyltransferase involved in cell wall biosynthesis